jgi:hypothetical protein
MSYLINDAAQGMGLKKMMVAGEDIGSHKLVYVASDGKCYLSNANAVSTMPATGISCGEISNGGTGEILFLGLIGSTGWSWATGGESGLLYPSTDAGELTQSKPLVSGNQVQIVATVITENLILFNPNYVLVEVS